MEETYPSLPYDRSNPIVYDNDAHADVYTDELLLALASAGEIDLRGFITSSQANPYVNGETYALDAAGRQAIIDKARRSGLRNTPPHVLGPARALSRPASGRIEETVPVDSAGSRFVVRQAARATPQRPLVIVMGGPLTVAADAYLLDPSIAGRVIVAWLGGTTRDMGDIYNGWVDPWAAYIVLRRFRLFQFPLGQAMPHVPKERLLALPDSELRQWLIDKRLPHVSALGESWDGDGQPAIALLRQDYVRAVRRVSFDRWVDGPDGRQVPGFRDDPGGNALVVTEASGEVATAAWWEAMTDPRAWGESDRALPAAQRPFYAAPFPVGGLRRVEAEDYDRGGEGLAYHVVGARPECGVSEGGGIGRPYRAEGVPIVPAGDVPGGYNVGARGGYCVTGLRAGDWLAYTIDVAAAGRYDVGLRVASAAPGGVLHVSFDGEDATGPLGIPDTGGALAWETVVAAGVRLRAGRQVMRLVVDRAGVDGQVASVNYVSLVPGAP